MSIEAMKQALEALKDFGNHRHDCPQWPTYTEPEKYPACDCGYDKAITSLRQAIAEAEKQEPVLVVEKEPDYMSGGHFHAGTKPHIDPTKVWSLPIGTKLYDHPQPKAEKQEPVGWLDSNDIHAEFMHKLLKAEHDKRGSSTPRMFQIPLYTRPQPKREPLTDEAIMARWPFRNFYSAALEFARSIEAAHGITSDIKQENVDKTTKQRHEWVGLTPEEIDNIEFAGLATPKEKRELVRAIEAKLKEKNT